VAAEVAGQDPSVEQSYRFGFHRLGAVLAVSVLVGLATLAGLILLVIPGIWIGIRLCVSVEALVVEGTQAMGRSWELVGVLLYLDLRARKEALTLEQLRADLQASAT
jgi:hypothetical protein